MPDINWSTLTRMPAKAAAYQRETYFREGLAAAEEVLGGSTAAVLHRTAILLLKPDGVVTGCLAPVLGFLQEYGYRVVAARYVELTPIRWREMWRYQLTSATLDRLALNDHVYAVGPALLLVLGDRSDAVVPAAVRLSGQKGSSDPLARRPDSLRSRLGEPTRILSRIHVADEPADIARELALLLDPPDRRRVYAAMATGRLEELDQALLAKALENEVADARSTDLAPPLNEVERAVRGLQPEGPAAEERVARVLGALDRIKAAQAIPWRVFTGDLDALQLKIGDWELAVLGSVSVPCDEAGHPKFIDNPPPGIWEENDARPYA